MTSCSICGSAQTRALLETDAGSIRKCRECETVFRDPLIADERHFDLYQNAVLMESQFYLTNKTALDSRTEPMLTYARGLERLEQLHPPGRLLDVGCSYGAFPDLARRRGWDAVGVEISAGPAEFARKERGLDVFDGTLEDAGFPDGHFQAITLWDVIEHLDDPVSTLSEARRVLAPGGILLVFTINHESLHYSLGNLLYRISRRRWKSFSRLFYDIHHNFFFSPRSFGALLQRTGGLEIADLRPGAANVSRWHTIPIPPVLMAGSGVIDALSSVVGRAYRMLVFARRIGSVGSVARSG